MNVNVTQRIDSAPIGSFQIKVVALCALVALLDGLDIQAMAIATPRIAEQWGMPTADFAPVLSASFAGIMVGTILLGFLGDRFGRRRVVLTAFLAVGVASILTAWAQSITQLIILRFLTGAAIGGCLPNVTALTTEYIPSRRAGTAVTLMYSAVPLGGVLGSLLAADLIALVDWQGIFILGGVAPFLISILLWRSLPESVRYLVGTSGEEARVAKILARIDQNYTPAAGDRFELDHQMASRGSVVELMRDGRATATVLLWLIFFFSMSVMYLMNSWLPSIFTASGWPMADAIRTLAFFQLGGIVGGLLNGWLLDRLGAPRVLFGAFVFGTLALLGLGLMDADVGGQQVLVTAAGFGIIGAQLVLTALAAIVYPTAIRATGVGWALGVGRLGAVLSPYLGGLAIGLGVSGPHLFIAASVPAMLCILGSLYLWLSWQTRDPHAELAAG